MSLPIVNSSSELAAVVRVLAVMIMGNIVNMVRVRLDSWNPLYIPWHKVTRQVQLPNHDVCKIAKKIEEDRVQNRKKKDSAKNHDLVGFPPPSGTSLYKTFFK